MTIQNVPSKSRISIMKFQNFTIERRQSVIPLVYGFLLLIISLVLATISPLERITEWVFDMTEGSFIFRMWEDPPYQLYTEVWVFNYTNVPEYLAGETDVLRVEEVGPFRYQERRTNLNMSINYTTGTMFMKPNINLTFLPEQSIGYMKDVKIYVPNIALIAMSTLAADHLGYLANAGAYYSMSALGSKLFLNMTVDDYLWGYYDPIVTIANKILPGWIDFGKIGIMDRFYGVKFESAEVQVKDPERRFAIEKWDGSAGFVERGFKDLNTSTLCTRIKDSFEGLTISPAVIRSKKIPIFRKQACRVIPFSFQKEMRNEHGLTFHRFIMEKTALDRSSPYACDCTRNCLPDGFIDLSSCYYGFPIALSKPHFLDADPKQMEDYIGIKPNIEKHTSRVDIEPTIGVPLALSTKVQVNLAVRSSAGNPLTKPVDKKILPLMWVSLYCEEIPSFVLNILKLRFVIAPPLLIATEVLLFLVGMLLGAQGFYRLWRPKYKLIEPVVPIRRKKSQISSYPMKMSDNIGFKEDDDDIFKEAVSLLSIKEDDTLKQLIVDD